MMFLKNSQEIMKKDRDKDTFFHSVTFERTIH